VKSVIEKAGKEVVVAVLTSRGDSDRAALRIIYCHREAIEKQSKVIDCVQVGRSDGRSTEQLNAQLCFPP
jgi:hypothetical protein